MSVGQLQQQDLGAFFEPRRVAVVGASASGRGLGAATLKSVVRNGFDGDVVAINGAGAEVAGVPGYRSLLEVPDPVDLVLVLTAADRVGTVLDDAATIGALGAIVYASGFSETGATGADLQARALGAVRRSPLRVLGPNCQGIVSYPSRFTATFSSAFHATGAVRPGPLAYVGQSGAVGGSLFDLGRERGVVPSYWVSTGNQADLGVVDVIEHLVRVGDCEVVMVYLESTPEGRAWQQLCQEAATAGTTLIVLRSGTTDAGQRAVASHTGALVANGRAFEALSERYGVVFARDIDELLHLAMAHLSGSDRAGHRVGVVSTSGGAGSLTVDHLDRHGLEPARFGGPTQAKLGERLVSFANPHNPLDTTADLIVNDPAGFGALCRIVADDPDVDQLIVVLSVVIGKAGLALVESLVAALDDSPVPTSVVYMAAHDRTADVRGVLAAAGIPVWDSISAAVNAIGRSASPTRIAVAKPPRPSEPSDGHLAAMTESAGLPWLVDAGFQVPRHALALTRADAVSAAADLGPTVVLKIQSTDIVHKTEVGGVRVGVPTSEVGEAYDSMVAAVARHAPAAVISGVLVQEQAAPGIELLLNVRCQSDGYPPLVTCGLGGTAVELFADVASRPLPIDEAQATEMLRSLRSWPLLDGHRGRPKADAAAAARAVAALGRLCELLGDGLVEIEINPLIVHEAGAGATCADFVAYLQGPHPT